MTNPSWLPETLSLDGVWEKNLAKLFKIFDQDFILKSPIIDGAPVWYDRTIKDGSLPEGFWHVITRDVYEKDKTGKVTKERYPDFRRAERLPWCAPSIDHSTDPVIRRWNIIERGEFKTYLWLENLDYAIVLVKRKLKIGDVMFIDTAFHIDGDSKKRDLNNRYANRIS